MKMPYLSKFLISMVAQKEMIIRNIFLPSLTLCQLIYSKHRTWFIRKSLASGRRVLGRFKAVTIVSESVAAIILI